jgi:hypothetical protein
MDGVLSRVTEWLLCASSQIGVEYFKLPIADMTEEEAAYRERVYCYELYHRWRCHWPDGFSCSLHGEVDKSGHSLIPDSPKPDFLVHVPGSMENNLLVMEVKTCKLYNKETALKNLIKFRRELKDQKGQPAYYHAAYFWVFGIGEPGLREKLESVVSQFDEAGLRLIRFFVHERALARATEVSWP